MADLIRDFWDIPGTCISLLHYTYLFRFFFQMVNRIINFDQIFFYKIHQKHWKHRHLFSLICFFK